MSDMPGNSDEELEAKLLGDTAKIPWLELQRFFARGRVLEVAAGIDLIAVSKAMIADDGAQFQQWINAGQIHHMPDELAQQLVENDALVWATVVAPWVLVQQLQ